MWEKVKEPYDRKGKCECAELRNRVDAQAPGATG